MPEVLKKVVEFAADEGISTSYDEVATLAEINAIAIKHILPRIEDYIFRPSPILAYMKRAIVKEGFTPVEVEWEAPSPQ